METLTEGQLQKVAHALGINIYDAKLSKRKKDKSLPDEFYRNYYNFSRVADKIPTNLQVPDDLLDLLNKGIIKTWQQHKNNYFCVTNEGILKFREYFKKHVTDTYKPLSKSKQTYQDYLHADTGWNFDEWLNIKPPKLECRSDFGYSYGYRYTSTKYYNIHGLWSPTKIEAKRSYKEALRLYKIMLKN